MGEDILIMNAKIQADLNDIAILVRVVQAKSFSAAARERGVPVSTISRRIARLENSIGVRLIERTTRRLRLTDLGRAYFDHAERALDELTIGARLLGELQEEPRGRVRVTAPLGLGPVIAASLESYLADHPAVNVELDLSERRVDLVGEGFDIAIRTGKVDESDFIARALGGSPRRLYASPAYIARHGAPRRLSDLRTHDCVATRTTESGTTWTLFRNAKRERVSFVPRLFVNELGAAKQAVVAGVGIGLFPATMSQAEVSSGSLVHVLRAYEGEMVGVHLLYRARRSLTAAVRTCVDYLLHAVPIAKAKASADQEAKPRPRLGRGR
jgi:DNA-binding transcriptional LysR family regulator